MTVGQEDGCRSHQLSPHRLFLGTYQPSRFTNTYCFAIVLAIHPLFLPIFGTTTSFIYTKIFSFSGMAKNAKF
jgi:hypothetical protein